MKTQREMILETALKNLLERPGEIEKKEALEALTTPPKNETVVVTAARGGAFFLHGPQRLSGLRVVLLSPDYSFNSRDHQAPVRLSVPCEWMLTEEQLKKDGWKSGTTMKAYQACALYRPLEVDFVTLGNIVEEYQTRLRAAEQADQETKDSFTKVLRALYRNGQYDNVVLEQVAAAPAADWAQAAWPAENAPQNILPVAPGEDN